MKIKVTAKHIRTCKKGDDLHCAVAIALQEQFPGECISARYYSISIGARALATPEDVRTFMLLLDGSGFGEGKANAKPFEFELEV